MIISVLVDQIYYVFQEFDDLLNEDRLTRVPTLVYANKQDLETAESRYVVCLFIKISETKISKKVQKYFEKSSKILFKKKLRKKKC